MDEMNFTKVVIDGVEWPDFGFRSFTAHLNDYDLFRDFEPCYRTETNALITAYYQRNLADLLTPAEKHAMGIR